MSDTFKTTIEREKQVMRGDGVFDDVTEELNIEVTYDYSKAEKETWGYDGGSPAEPESVEIISAVDLATGDELTLTKDEEDAFEQEALKEVQSRYEAAAEDKAERQWEQRQWNRENPMD